LISPSRNPSGSVNPSTTPIELLLAQVDCETFTLPTGANVFSRGTNASAIYGLKRGIVELEGPDAARICYRPGELFSFQDIVWRQGQHRSDALARTPVEILKLDRLRFLNLLHNHPTLAILLIGQQHDRLREQRASGTCVY
jgi:CRP/FNR family cyclic AMP-dependent transcriptional regulator